METVLESLPLEDLKPDDLADWTPGQTEISGILVHVPFVYTREKVREQSVDYDEIRVDDDFVNGSGITQLLYCFDGFMDEVVPQKNTSTIADCLLVAWTDEHEKSTGPEDDSDAALLDLIEPAEALAAQSSPELTLSLVILNWHAGIASRAGVLQFRLRAKELSAEMQRMRPLKATFMMD
ncbi:uncharacterized protein AB675_928 [Cyphellophora attinorum]|uniref:Uncharacterized protein n=1 Tax=Cyphellophora attinorum TaxID=1664694 RepID=A0A0N1HB07_9EURO|nr:uncharacterized protein AB675_928 [Phialophora attinorum]KPI45497.1 hypothetical protein AB675_928 [Phialophora attinorum]